MRIILLLILFSCCFLYIGETFPLGVTDTIETLLDIKETLDQTKEGIEDFVDKLIPDDKKEGTVIENSKSNSTDVENVVPTKPLDNEDKNDNKDKDSEKGSDENKENENLDEKESDEKEGENKDESKDKENENENQNENQNENEDKNKDKNGDAGEDNEDEKGNQEPISDLVDHINEEISQFDVVETYHLISSEENRSTLVSIVMVISLVLCFFGYRSLKFWFFLAGFLATTLFFFMLLPSIFDTSICCGKGTELVHALVSCAIGIVGGILALFVLKIGLFLTGCCFGVIVAILIVASPLGSLDFFDGKVAFVLFYLGCSVIGGILALFFQKPFVVLTTSIGGAFGFFIGLDYFCETNFNILAVLLIEKFKETFHLAAPEKEDLENIQISAGGYAMFAFWIFLSLVGIIVQYKSTKGLPVQGNNQNDKSASGSVVVVVENSRKKKNIEKKVNHPTSFLGGFFGGTRKRKDYEKVMAEDDSSSDSDDDFEKIIIPKNDKYKEKAGKYKSKAQKYKNRLKKLKNQIMSNFGNQQDKQVQIPTELPQVTQPLLDKQNDLQSSSSSSLDG